MGEKKDELLPSARIALFKERGILKTKHSNEWWFSVVDVVGALTDSVDPGAYWRKLKERLKEEGCDVETICQGLKVTAPDGKIHETECASGEGVFRIIQSIPSPKTEIVKHWLSKTGCRRGRGMENPEPMTDLELIFTMLGEAATTEIARNKNVVGLTPNRMVAQEGGTVAGSARKDLERRSDRKVISAVNYKKLPEKEVRKLLES
jgi:hypothetical protein